VIRGRLRELDAGARVALTALVAVLGIGLAASGWHLREHHQNRDERPGVSLEDLVGAYHGVQTTAPLLSALERGHPEGLVEAERATLLGWLRSGRIVEDYDNIDLGDAAPEGLLRRRCLECHSRGAVAGDGIGERVPLEYFDDVKRVAFSKQVAPLPVAVLAASTHAHALSLAVMSAVVGLLLSATRWPRVLSGALFAAAGVALLADFAAQWLARGAAGWVPVLVASGSAYVGATALSLALILIDLWRPLRSGGAGRDSPRPFA
jgi:hypothetical protein